MEEDEVHEGGFHSITRKFTVLYTVRTTVRGASSLPWGIEL